MTTAWHAITALFTAGPASPAWWLAGPGLLGIFAVLFAEACTPAGFFLPGDSLLLTAGALAASTQATIAHASTAHASTAYVSTAQAGQPRLSLAAVILVALAGTVTGMQAGYLLGRRAGRSLRPEGRFALLATAADRGGRLLARAGPGRALLIARFIPVVRVVIGPLCGSAGMPAARFTRWQVAGAGVWTVSTTLAGFLAARQIPGLTTYLIPVLMLGMAISAAITLLKARQARRAHQTRQARRAHQARHQDQPPSTSQPGQPRRGGQATTRTADEPSGGPRAARRSAMRSLKPATRPAGCTSRAPPPRPLRSGHDTDRGRTLRRPPRCQALGNAVLKASHPARRMHQPRPAAQAAAVRPRRGPRTSRRAGGGPPGARRCGPSGRRRG